MVLFLLKEIFQEDLIRVTRNGDIFFSVEKVFRIFFFYIDTTRVTDAICFEISL